MLNSCTAIHYHLELARGSERDVVHDAKIKLGCGPDHVPYFAFERAVFRLGELVPEYEAKLNTLGFLLDNLKAGDCWEVLEQVWEELARNPAAIHGLQHIQLPSHDFSHDRQAAPTGARAPAGDGSIAVLVTNKRHSVVR